MSTPIEQESPLVYPLGPRARRQLTVLVGAALRTQQEWIYLWREVRSALLAHAGSVTQSSSIFGGCAGAEADIEAVLQCLAVAVCNELERPAAEKQARRIGLEWSEVLAAAKGGTL